MKDRGLYLTDPKAVRKIVDSEGLLDIYNK